MLKSGVLGIVLWAALSLQLVVPSFEPLAKIAVSRGGAVAFVPNGDYLLVADDTVVQLYDVSDPTNTADVASFELDAVPSALIAVDNFALVAVAGGAELSVLAPDDYLRAGYGLVNVVDAPEDVDVIAVSPDQKWAFASGRNGYVILSLGSADYIEGSSIFPTGERPIVTAAMLDDAVLFVREGVQQVERLDIGRQIFANAVPRLLDLDSEATALAVNPAGTLGVVALTADEEDDDDDDDGYQLVFFDPQTLKEVSTLDLDDGAVVDIVFLQSGDAEFIALQIGGRRGVMIFDVTDPDEVSLPGSVEIRAIVHSIASYGDLLAVSGGRMVEIFQLSAP